MNKHSPAYILLSRLKKSKKTTYPANTKYPITKPPKTIRYQPKALKSLFLIYPNKNLIATMETPKATSIPVISMATSIPVKTKPNLTSFRKLAPNMTGIDRKRKLAAL